MATPRENKRRELAGLAEAVDRAVVALDFETATRLHAEYQAAVEQAFVEGLLP